LADFDDTQITKFKSCLSSVHFSSFSGPLYLNDSQVSHLHPTLLIAKSSPSSLTVWFLKFICKISNNPIATSQ